MPEDSPKSRSRLFGEGIAYAELYPSIGRRLEAALNSSRPEIRRRLSALKAAEVANQAKRHEKLMRDFGLTITEARLAMYLGEGGSVAGYAEVFGVAVSTVRSQLKSVFAKTGVNRQGALAAIVPRP
ncbi:helix-turn-helix transcriptional regulator [Phenylobacterium sp.]|uniref:helix-turn-helix transcriptional regulator n=1 Tax=Phenylobacterium sp. TaxID=1871053 RepID=UPI002B55C852|nr:helix-turn-helix transcriptional regulator [Phenylobacterium sp.]HLZ76933.1 helix-turn-helix transcriptional regulator [Phenylobacterium sp.]